ncbi:MAG: MarR family winged helix-turn-helix transcriptional regulator [Gemmatimonadaceae bacterium]
MRPLSNAAPPSSAASKADVVAVIDSIRSIVQQLRVSGRDPEQPTGISSAQMYVLQALKAQPALSINELADRTFTHQSSVSMVVRRLVQSGLVSRVTSKTDSRRLSVSLTPAGKMVVRKSPNGTQKDLVNALQKMPQADVHSLATHLVGLADIMSGETVQR